MTDTPSSKPLAGRIALVTGASRGIGRASALALAGAGAHVVAVARTQGALESLDDEIKAVSSEGATLVPMDLLSGDNIDRLGAALYERWGRLDILVSAAAELGVITPVGHLEPRSWDRILNLNLTANWRLLRSFDPLFRRAEAARLIFLTSRVATEPKAFWGAYAASKAGLETLVRVYADEVENTPIRTTRTREVKSGIVNPFRLTTRLKLDALSSPHWMRALIRNGIPRFVNFQPYMGADTGIEAGASFMQREGGGAFTWDEVARYRDKWKKPLLVKGVLHPEDAEKCVALGLDGIVVSNHGGRQIDALPAPIDTLPVIASAVGRKMTILYDSGVRTGVDVARAIALGADGALAGKPFLWSLGALGEKGPAHLIETFIDELRATLGQLGCPAVPDLRQVSLRHPGAWRPDDFAARA